MPIQGAVSYSDIATERKVPESTLKAVARMAMTHGFLQETEDGLVMHTPRSAALSARPELSDWILYMGGTSAPVAAKFTDATEKWGQTTQKYETAYNICKATDLPFFDHVGRDAERRRQFAGYMKNVTASDSTSVRHLLAGFAWKDLGAGTVVDVSRPRRGMPRRRKLMQTKGWRLERPCKHRAGEDVSRAELHCPRPG